MKRKLSAPERATVLIHDILSVATGNFTDDLEKLQAEGNFNINAVFSLINHYWLRIEEKLYKVAEAMGTRGAIDINWQVDQWEKKFSDPDTILALMDAKYQPELLAEEYHITPVEIEMLLRHTPEEVETLIQQLIQHQD